MLKTNGKRIIRAIGKGVVRTVDSIVNLAVLFVVLIVFAYGCYGLWDTSQIYENAGGAKYESYKPTDKDGALSFKELKEKNPDVLGWLTVYGTGIDYPLLQGADNEKYLHTDAQGEYSYSGSIFLDFRSRKDFSDFNTIIHGHHMEKDAMFGDIADFKEKDFFKSHPHGNLYYEGKDYGLEFFAFLNIDAYNRQIYQTGVEGKKAKKTYLQSLYDAAVYVRDVEFGPKDHIVLLSTCASESTNGRNILVGRITKEPFADTFQKEGSSVDMQNSTWQWILQLPMWVWFIAGVFSILLLVLLIRSNSLRKKKRVTGIRAELEGEQNLKE